MKKSEPANPLPSPPDPADPRGSGPSTPGGSAPRPPGVCPLDPRGSGRPCGERQMSQYRQFFQKSVHTWGVLCDFICRQRTRGTA